MIERLVQRAVNRGDCRHEQEESAVSGERCVRRPKEFVVALDVLQHIHGYHRVSAKAIADALEVALVNADTRIAIEPSPQFRDVVLRWLDQQHLLRSSLVEN